jgi:ubiquinone/menaquinone biosynthesis C-methylase UbiE
MQSPFPQPQRPDYGLDAPGVVRNLILCGVACLLIWVSAAAGLWSGQVGPFVIAPMALGTGIGLTCTGLWMMWNSKFGKLRTREWLLDRISWTGQEQVLDVGCGRGLMLVGAAKRLTTGKATGIDIWQSEDLSGNRPEAALENAHCEGVADRVEVQTADMRQIPLPDGSIDVVVSRAAIHNLYDSSDRAQAIREIARVLRPGGRAVIDDIRHGRQYTAIFADAGCTDCRSIGSPTMKWFTALLTFGSLRPETLVVSKGVKAEEKEFERSASQANSELPP